jgi:predicted small lipoprotein YifL
LKIVRAGVTSPSVIAVSLVLAASLVMVAGCGRRGNPVPVKAETSVQTERRTSSQVVEERARLGIPRPADKDLIDERSAATAPLPDDAPDQVLQTRPDGRFFLDFLL